MIYEYMYKSASYVIFVNHHFDRIAAYVGIDVPETSHVFQYSLPDDVETYLHRSGRTGRLGRHGTWCI